MDKHRIITRFGFDGVTIAAAPTDYALVDGWTQGTLTGPAGHLPADLRTGLANKVTGSLSAPGLRADAPALGQGWHAVEHQGGDAFRWTDGDALVPLALLGGTAAPLRIAVRGWHAPLLLAPAGRAVRAAA